MSSILENMKEYQNMRQVKELTDWCYSNGVVIQVKSKDHDPHCAITHVPMTLEPFHFPNDVFLEAKRLASIFNKVFSKPEYSLLYYSSHSSRPQTLHSL